MSIPTSVANQLLVDCMHRCCKCRRAYVQIHHIEYISDNGDDSYENLIPLCPNCHTEVHTLQAAQGAPGVSVRAITPEQLKIYKQNWIDYCKNVIHIKGGLTESTNWHYYWNSNRVHSLAATLNIPSKSTPNSSDHPSYNAECSHLLCEIERILGFWDLSYLITKNSLIDIIGSYVTIKGTFEGNIQSWGYYFNVNGGWDKETPSILTTNLPHNGRDYSVELEIYPQYVTTVTTFSKLRQNPYLQVIGVVWNVDTKNNIIKISPLHLCPN